MQVVFGGYGMKTSKLIEQAVGLGLELQPVLAGGFFLLDPNRHQCRFGRLAEIQSDLDYYRKNGRLPKEAEPNEARK